MVGNVTFRYEGKLTTLDQMRAELPDSILLPALDRVIRATHTASLSHTPCPVHNKLPQIIVNVSANGEIDIETNSCCDLMEKKVTGPLRSTLNATAYFQPGMTLSLQVQDDFSQPYSFDAHMIEKLILGRQVPEDNSPLHIDLNQHGGKQKGVSRRHAWIIWKSGALHLVDNSSVNGTFLNGAHLNAFEPYKLHDKDVIRLGNLNIKMRIVDD